MSDNTKALSLPELKKYITEGLNAKVMMEGQKELLDSIAETVEEKSGMKKAEFKRRVTLRYEQEYNSEKYYEKKEKLLSAYDDLEAISNNT